MLGDAADFAAILSWAAEWWDGVPVNSTYPRGGSGDGPSSGLRGGAGSADEDDDGSDSSSDSLVTTGSADSKGVLKRWPAALRRTVGTRIHELALGFAAAELAHRRFHDLTPTKEISPAVSDPPPLP